MVVQALENRVLDNSTKNHVGSVYDSIVPEVRESLTYSQKEFIQRLDGFEAPYLKEKLMAGKKFKSIKKYHEAFREFKKYVALVALGKKERMSMTSPNVDEVWHQFILFTPQYHDFCNQFLGRYMHHIPKTSHTPLGEDGRKNFVKNYMEMFGNVPGIWNIKNGDCEKCTEEGCNMDPDPD